MQTTIQAPAAPATPAAPSAPGAAAATQAPAARSITVVGADGKTETIILPSAGPVIAGTEAPPAPVAQPTEDYFAQGAAVGVTMTLIVLGIFALYNRWKYRGVKREVTSIQGESAARLERVERGMEAIAIEIERISEGQRFVTKALADTRVPVIPSEKTNS
jgi:hypothetical protein